MRLRWSTAEWRLIDVGPSIDIMFKDGDYRTVTMEQAQSIDPNDVESVSIYEPNTEPITKCDKETAEVYLRMVEVWRLHGVSVFYRDFL